ncbi:MAG: thioredoxin-dependent thiol peroxidase [Chloroflexi bacterium]|jgi:peroxiredoxin Q/BCP|nr:thioredoxin-dependent thiol peroxidase [Chloroflexota bacterium]
MLKEGALAPDFTLLADTGEEVTLSSFRGSKVVVYFYPKDDTPGCTKEACSFRDDYAQFTALGAVVIGISPDSAASHAKFRLKFDLPFYLVSDPDHSVAEAYGAWGEKRNYGRTYEGIIRSTFVVGEDGALIKVFGKVKPEGHAQEVLPYLQ